jgi:hypothetical protein
MKVKHYIIATALTATLATPLATHAQNLLSASRLSAIQQRCTVLQTSLDQLQRRDLVARTNRGREYENVNRQAEALIQRLHNNNLTSSTLDTPLADFKTTIANFRDAYVRYDDSMTALRQIDCSRHPSDFAQSLEQARVLRAAVGVEVTKGEKSLGQFRAALVALKATLPKPLVQGVKQ